MYYKNLIIDLAEPNHCSYYCFKKSMSNTSKNIVHCFCPRRISHHPPYGGKMINYAHLSIPGSSTIKSATMRYLL